jgi:hypothetical protein
LNEVKLVRSLVQNGDSAFSSCLGLKQVTLHGTVAKVSRNTFGGCQRLERVTLPGSLTVIGRGAFGGCLCLKGINLPGSLVQIESGAFAGCARLKKMVLPGSLTRIGVSAFAGCTALLELELPTSIRTVCGGDGRLGRGVFEDCSSLRVLVIPSTLTLLDAAAFRGSVGTLRMLVVAATISDDVASTLAEMLGLGRGETPGATLDLPAVFTVQLVSAPNIVVASLGGVFADMTTMDEVRAARLHVDVLDYRYWTVKTHTHQVCTAAQRLCARTVLLVGVRLDAQVGASSGLVADLSAATASLGRPQLLPLPNELWVELLGWLRRSELGE